MKYILLILFLSFVGLSFAQEEKKHIREGNKHYENEKYTEATESYKKALEKNQASEKATFNLGDALYKEQKFAEAAEEFKKIAEQSSNKELKASAFHNLGNSFLEAQKYQESIDAYKNALRLNPKDDETRYNLAYAQKKLKEQQQR